MECLYGEEVEVMGLVIYRVGRHVVGKRWKRQQGCGKKEKAARSGGFWKSSRVFGEGVRDVGRTIENMRQEKSMWRQNRLWGGLKRMII